jgi:hypothetical protein
MYKDFGNTPDLPEDQKLHHFAEWGVSILEQNARLSVVDIVKDGPLYYQGVRKGYELSEIGWLQDGKPFVHKAPNEVIEALSGTVAMDTLVRFRVRRNRSDEFEFQSFPAWHPLLSLFATHDRDWACWTEHGYYDASFNGDRLLGWQVNRGLRRLPETYRAPQMRRTMERPEIIRRLLGAGNLFDAAREARAQLPGQPQHALRDQIRLRPIVRITDPAPGSMHSGRDVEVLAELILNRGQSLVRPKLFANGVIADNLRKISSKERDGMMHSVYRWLAAVPNEHHIKLHLIAAADEGAIASDYVTISHQHDPDRRLPRLVLLAAGVGDYADPQIGRLDFAAESVLAVSKSLTEKSTPWYASVTVQTLVDSQVYPAMWHYVTRETADRLRAELGPDDLVVIYLYGHGVRDEETGEYYYVGRNARLADIRRGSYQDCLGVTDLRAFADISCRKLLILDTCHGGAVHEHLSSADFQGWIRSFQADQFLVFSASEAQEEAVEDDKSRLGRFTHYFVEACSGAADTAVHGGNEDGVVRLHEVIEYVRREIGTIARTNGRGQHPVAGPADLLQFIDLPLTNVGVRRD